MLVGVLRSLSEIVIVADEVAPSVTPSALLNVTVNLSDPSIHTSFMSGMIKILDVSPGANRTVPTLVT